MLSQSGMVYEAQRELLKERDNHKMDIEFQRAFRYELCEALSENRGEVHDKGLT